MNEIKFQRRCFVLSEFQYFICLPCYRSVFFWGVGTLTNPVNIGILQEHGHINLYLSSELLKALSDMSKTPVPFHYLFQMTLLPHCVRV